MNKLTTILFSLVAILWVGSQSATAQCKVFTAKTCNKTLGDFTNNGAYNAAVMFEGEEASMAQTFYGGQDYKIVLCTQGVLDNHSYFELKDYKGNLLYSSKNAENNEFEFSVENTQNLRVRVVVPRIDGGQNNIKKNGCVSILVGFKETSTSTAIYEDTSHDLH